MLTGRLVRLRAYEPADAATLLSWVNDADFREFLNLRYPLARAQEVEWASRGGPTYAATHFAVEHVETGELIGGVDLRTGEPADRTAELGISIGRKDLWDKGYGTDALLVACAFGFDDMDLARISLTVFDGNDRARRSYEKAGFVHEGTARQAVYKRGARHDLHLYGLLPHELRRAASPTA